jgi:hypothetical protein
LCELSHYREFYILGYRSGGFSNYRTFVRAFDRAIDSAESRTFVRRTIWLSMQLSIPIGTILQLADLLKFIENYKSCSLSWDFYEQGTERLLIFSHVGKFVNINCLPLVMKSNNIANNSKDSWGQYIEDEPLTRHNLKSMIGNLITTFVSIAHEIGPTLTSHKCFQEWCNDKYIANCWRR